MLNITPRQGLVVWVYSLKQIKALRHYGTVMYVSRRMKYVYLYLDRAAVPETMAKLKKLRFVKAVEPSHRPELDMNFGARVGEFDSHQDPLRPSRPQADDDDDSDKPKLKRPAEDDNAGH